MIIAGKGPLRQASACPVDGAEAIWYYPHGLSCGETNHPIELSSEGIEHYEATRFSEGGGRDGDGTDGR